MASARGSAGNAKLRWYQFDLRTLLVLVLAVAGLFSWLRWRAVEAQRDEAEGQATSLIGHVVYEFGPEPTSRRGQPIGILEVEVPPGSEGSRIPLLADLRRCRRIVLRGTALDDAGLVFAIQPKGIERLDLTGTAVTEEGIRQLASLGSLRELVLDHTPLGDDCVEAIRRIPKLEVVSLRGTHVTAEGAGRLEASAHGLRVLWATAPSEAQRQVAVALEAREVPVDARRTNTRATTYGVMFGREQKLSHGPEVLRIMPVDPCAFLPDLARLKVSRITLRGPRIDSSRPGYGALFGGLEHLRELRLEGLDLSPRQQLSAHLITRLTNLTRLSLCDCALANAELASLAAMPNLEEFVLQRPRHYERALPKDGKVIWEVCAVNNDGLVHFRSMKRLRRLALRDVRWNVPDGVDLPRPDWVVQGAEGAIAPQRRWTARDVEVNDAGMEHLAALAELESLDLSGSPVTAAGLLKLRGLKKLRELVVADVPLTDDDKAQLQKALPQATLSFRRSDGGPEEEPLP